MKYNLDLIMDAIEELLLNKELEKKKELSESIKLNIVSFDEKYLRLTALIEENPEIEEILTDARIRYLNEAVHNATKHVPTYIPYSEKKMMKARLELLQVDLHKYTLEELASLVRE